MDIEWSIARNVGGGVCWRFIYRIKHVLKIYSMRCVFSVGMFGWSWWQVRVVGMFGCSWWQVCAVGMFGTDNRCML